MQDFKFTACQLMYTFIYESRVFESLVTYSKVKRINRRYVNSLYYKTYVRDQGYSNMIIVLR